MPNGFAPSSVLRSDLLLRYGREPSARKRYNRPHVSRPETRDGPARSVYRLYVFLGHAVLRWQDAAEPRAQRRSTGANLRAYLARPASIDFLEKERVLDQLERTAMT